MKKFCALVFSSFFCAACYILGWHLLLKGFSSFFLLYISPVLSASGFLLLERLFDKMLRLNKKLLWLTMNIMGDYFGWVWLSFMTEERAPASLKYGVFRIILHRCVVFFILWGIIWSASMVLQRMKKKGINCTSVLLNGLGMLLCILSVAAICFSFWSDGISEWEGAAVLFISGLYLIGYVFLLIHNREKYRTEHEEYSVWRKSA